MCGYASLVVDANGSVISEQRYKPFAPCRGGCARESRYRATTTFPTDFQFTGVYAQLLQHNGSEGANCQ